jgi:hypothetical protein
MEKGKIKALRRNLVEEGGQEKNLGCCVGV